MRTSEEVNGRMLGEKRRGARGRTAAHCSQNRSAKVRSGGMRGDGRETYEAEEHEPGREDDACEYERDEARGDLLFWAEGVLDLGERAEGRCFCVLGDGKGRGNDEVEEVEFCGRVDE